MSFKSGNVSTGLQTSDGAAKDLTVANVNDANQRAEADRLISNQQATENAKFKGELHKSAQADEIPAGYARFVSAHQNMSYIKKDGSPVYWRFGRLDTDDADAITELRAALKSGNNTFWEVKSNNVVVRQTKQPEASTFNQAVGSPEPRTGSVETSEGMTDHDRMTVKNSSPGRDPVPLSKSETSVKEVTSPTGKVGDTKLDKSNPEPMDSDAGPKKEDAPITFSGAKK